ncbi:uncharacterized protein BJ171DRAFT_490421 [Polychytrium aggregatum]|uniref:uncharacterized protein n=1 Tax=Polychytrium aggregatum TaxID=110093 RepID=UPI0022FEB221|nr:uncharacterized protein BJ171DRAFT_490421 [Polychytrium aggregatum]KAI9208169.1 hypothetical protein BJ171DRAFT_490421 [Polychytrium aggregatum]
MNISTLLQSGYSRIATSGPTWRSASSSLQKPIFGQQWAQMHSSPAVSSRSQPLEIVRSRRSIQRAQRRAERDKIRFGDKYRPKTTPAPVPSTIEGGAKLTPVFATPSNLSPASIVPQNLGETLKHLASKAVSTEPDNESSSKSQRVASETQDPRNLRNMTRRDNNIVDAIAEMTLAPDAIPPKPETVAVPESLAVPEETKLPEPLQHGPFYNYGLTHSDIKFLLEDTQVVHRNRVQNSLSATPAEQSEMVRRILSIENSSKKQLTELNKLRIMDVFAKKPFDTGSPAVQIGVFTVQIQALEDHLQKHKKDKSNKRQLQLVINKRHRMLKYLRRKNLQEFLDVCEAAGVNPESIRV